jgi:flagellar motor switch protein FliN/FliY
MFLLYRARMAAAATTVVSPPPSAHPSTGAPAATALVPVPPKPAASSIPPDSPVAMLRVEVEVGVPVRNFRVRNLLVLEPGVIVESQWNHGEDLPLEAGDVQLAWTEFEVVEGQLAARLTRIA